MVSLAYAFTLAMIGLAMFAFTYLILDQVVEGYLWPFVTDWQLNGTVIMIMHSMENALPVLIAVTALIGLIASAHETKND